MKRRYVRGLALAAATLIPLGMAGAATTAAMAASGSPAGAAATRAAPPSVAHVTAAGARPASSTPAWTGNFTGFPSASWESAWGIIPDSQQCQGATTSAPCNWGYSNMQPLSDSTAPGTGDALHVTYPKNSGPPSCVASSPGCVLGGGQFYQNLGSAGLQNIASSPTVDLRYYYKFPVGFDFGKKTAGKMPGLYGGVPGCESGGQHCNGGWSTRYMWRGGSSSDPDGELYFYSDAGSGYGADICLGNWTFSADGQWHWIEQLVNVSTGQITIWIEGSAKPVCSVTENLGGTPASGIFFSTFHGGHDTSWSPTQTTTDEFADFTLDTSQQGQSSGPATPANLQMTGATNTSISLSWTEPSSSDPATSYDVEENGAVVTTSATTSATVTGLAPGTSHTYTVVAVDASGNQSAPSAPVTGSTTGGGGGGGLTATITETKDWGNGYNAQATITNNSGATVTGWTVQFDLDPSMNIEGYWSANWSSSGNQQTFTNLSSDATIPNGGSVSFGFTGDYTTSYIPPTNVTVNGQGNNGPPTPANLQVTGTTNSSIALSWTEPSGSDPAVSYNVNEGGAVVTTSASTSATVTGLNSGTSYTFTVTAVDASGHESAPSAPVTGTTTGGGGVKFTQADIDAAVAAPLIAFAAPTASVPRPGTNPVNIYESKVLYYLALVDKAEPGATATNGTTVDSALLAQVRNLIAGGNEPDADGGLEGWSHAPVAQALLLVRNGPAWSELSSAEQAKVSLLEEAMGFAGNYTYNDANNFSSGICGFGNFSKTNNPNYEDGYVDVELAAIEYFGASNWDKMLAGFNDSTMVSELDSDGLTNAGSCYKTVGSAANSAIQSAFVWKGIPATNPMGIWNQLAADTFDQKVTSSVSGTSNGSPATAHIADGTTSPYQGQCCMGHEFNSSDSSGMRSSALYVFEGWMNVTGSRVAMSVLGGFSCPAAGSAPQYKVGSLDLIYKLHHGYISYALNQDGILVDDHGDPSTDGPNAKGYQFDLDAYNNIVVPQSC